MLDDFLILLGRFHPLFVHLPIGFIILGILVELNKKKLGWSNEEPCFYKVKLKENVPLNYLNVSAKKIHSVKKVSYLKKYIQDSNFLNTHDKLNAALVTPDAEIVENPNKLSPAYVVFNNYKLVLKWNRSLRFALAVCTLKDKFKNEL